LEGNCRGLIKSSKYNRGYKDTIEGEKIIRKIENTKRENLIKCKEQESKRRKEKDAGGGSESKVEEKGAEQE
jgi:hypothetical protein